MDDIVSFNREVKVYGVTQCIYLLKGGKSQWESIGRPKSHILKK